MARILIMNEDPDICEGCRVVLHSRGFEVRCIEDPEAGITMAREFQPDLMILDDGGEEPDIGMRVAKAFRREGFDKPILMLTDLGNATGFVYARDDIRLPVDAFQEKPVEPDRLLSLVRDLLAGKTREARNRPCGA